MESGRLEGSIQPLVPVDATGRLTLHAPDGPERNHIRQRAVLAGVALAAALAIVLAVWAIDMELRTGLVRRNVTLAGQSVGGLEPGQLNDVVATLARQYAASTVEIQPPGVVIKAKAPELGLVVRQDMTAAAVLNAGRGGFVLARFWDWVTSLVNPQVVNPVLRVDERSVARILTERDTGQKSPTEPNLGVRGDTIVAVDGQPGQGVAVESVTRALARDASAGLPLTLKVQRTALRPRYKLADAELVAAEANRRVTTGVKVASGAASATVPTSTVRSWLTAVPTDSGLRLSVDAKAIPATLNTLLAAANRPAVDAGFNVDNGVVVITPSSTGTRCCAPQTAGIIERALLNPNRSEATLVIPLETLRPQRDEARAAALGVNEVVGTFTTSHAPGEARVRNIHRMADTVRGSVIEPGKTFSVNEKVGPRTKATGYADAPIIDGQGMFTPSPGGGVSQFATTLFNAAFVAGLDITGYSMHSIYISRYPYGREATLSYPSIDLKLRNSTQAGVLIWPTYTDTSLTLTLYSTKSVEGTQTGQTKTPTGPNGECTAVVTERTRRYLADNRTTLDYFRGRYAPKEGVLCR